MNMDILEGKFDQLKGKAQQQWGKLTEDDMDIVSGDAKQLVGKIQEKYGVGREEAEKQVDEWLKENS
ncbi:CsbD family protein [Leucothrix sargassi]|nr:CsbD family protein [Leucothrix sargassi]